MNQNEVISGLVANAIITTAQLANELCIQTKGEFIIPEADYLHLVKDFQYRIAKRIMPLKTSQELKEEATKFIKELLEISKGREDNGNDGSREEDKPGLVSDSEKADSKVNGENNET